MIGFADPAPAVEPTGLQEGECERCRGRALVDAKYAGPVHCSACWSKIHNAPAVGNTRRPRFVGGERPGRAATEPILDRLGRAARTPSRLVNSPYRVLIGAQEATPSQIPAGAAVLAAAAREHGRMVRVTYALAEERATGRMVHSCAVRIAGLGYAVWWDGQYANAHAVGLRNVNQAHMLALAGGVEYVPPEPRPAPPVGPCPRCGQSVRWRTVSGAAITYKHQRDLGGENSRGQRIACE